MRARTAVRYIAGTETTGDWESHLKTATLAAVRGDIADEHVDAIVTAANSDLAGGGGVDGAVHRAAGPELLEACARLGGCPTGEAKLTAAYGRLEANGVRFVIHAVGPIWRGGSQGEAELLRRCYEAAMRLAAAHGARSVAFPAISTGVYGYPVAAAARIAVDAVRAETREASSIAVVRFVCFSDAALAIYRRLLEP